MSGPACFSVHVVVEAGKLICLLKTLSAWSKLLHDGSVYVRFDVILSVAGIDYPLSFRVLPHLLLHKHSFEAHVRCHRLEREIECF